MNMLMPNSTIHALAPWIKMELQRWKEDEERIARGSAGLSAKERMAVSDVWKAKLDEVFVDAKRMEGSKL
jgi:hypothetical protein